MLKKFIVPVFLLVCLAQILVPANMIRERENVLKSGEEYRFRIRPIDPKDPMRGSYIALQFAEEEVRIKEGEQWQQGEAAYLSLDLDSDGYAIPGVLTRELPVDREFIQVNIRYQSRGGDQPLVRIAYPFDRFYMEESAAVDAEVAYNESVADTALHTYALVSVLDGQSVLKDVMIGSESIRELVKNSGD